MKNKTLTIIIIVLLSIICIGLTIFMIGMLNGKINFKNFNIINKVSNKLIVDKVYDNNFNEININASASNIYVKNSTDGKIKVLIYDDEDNTSIDSSNNKLIINLKEKSCIGFCFNVTLSKIEIFIPSDYDKNIVIKNNYGDIEVDKFLNSNITITEDCGDVLVKGGNQVDIKNDYGDITLEYAISANINQAAGDVKVGTVNDITVKNQYGDTKIENVNSYLNIEENCGDIEIKNIVLEKNSYIKNDLGDITLGSTNEIYINTKTDLGSTDIKNNYKNSNIKLNIENNCGDITVNN